MAEETVDRSSLAAAEEADLLEYGAISPAAVGALLLGLLSLLALWQLLLLVVPLVALLTALLALRQIARSEGALVGRWAAIAGLGLALLASSIAIASAATRNWRLHTEATAFSDAWLELVRQGQLQQAHQLHLLATDRQSPGVSLSRFYQTNDKARGDLEQFFSESPLKEVVEAEAHARCVFHSAEINDDPSSAHVALRYRLLPAGEDSPPTEFVVVLQRARTDTGGVWRTVAVTPLRDEAIR